MALTKPGELASLVDIVRQAKENFGHAERAPYIAHKELLAKGTAHPPAAPQPTVYAFAEWVFGLTNNSDDDAKERGRVGERIAVGGFSEYRAAVRRKRAQLKQAAKKFEMAYYTDKRFPKSEWEVMFDGTSESAADALPISALNINGESVMAKPDLAFRHRSTGNVLIVELKTWRAQGRLPPFGWPSLKVQLWCYGLIDEWRDAPNVFLQGWVWRWVEYDPYEPDEPAGIQFPGLVLQPWLSNDPRVHKESVELFGAFGGHYLAYAST